MSPDISNSLSNLYSIRNERTTQYNHYDELQDESLVSFKQRTVLYIQNFKTYNLNT